MHLRRPRKDGATDNDGGRVMARKSYNIRSVSLTDAAARIYDMMGGNKSRIISALIIEGNRSGGWADDVEGEHLCSRQSYQWKYTGDNPRIDIDMSRRTLEKCNPLSKRGCCFTCWDTHDGAGAIACLNGQYERGILSVAE